MDFSVRVFAPEIYIATTIGAISKNTIKKSGCFTGVVLHSNSPSPSERQQVSFCQFSAFAQKEL
jgi:hypothetical protein